jgi:hypothetical protein
MHDRPATGEASRLLSPIQRRYRCMLDCLRIGWRDDFPSYLATDPRVLFANSNEAAQRLAQASASYGEHRRVMRPCS